MEGVAAVDEQAGDEDAGAHTEDCDEDDAGCQQERVCGVEGNAEDEAERGGAYGDEHDVVGDGAEHFSKDGGHGAEHPRKGVPEGAHPFFAADNAGTAPDGCGPKGCGDGGGDGVGDLVLVEVADSGDEKEGEEHPGGDDPGGDVHGTFSNDEELYFGGGDDGPELRGQVRVRHAAPPSSSSLLWTALVKASSRDAGLMVKSTSPQGWSCSRMRVMRVCSSLVMSRVTRTVPSALGWFSNLGSVVGCWRVAVMRYR